MAAYNQLTDEQIRALQSVAPLVNEILDRARQTMRDVANGLESGTLRTDQAIYFLRVGAKV